MGAIEGAIEQFDDLTIDILRLYFDTPEQLVPFVKSSTLHPREVKVGNL